MIEKMTKYSFILQSSRTDAFLSELQRLGVMDITRSEKPVDDESRRRFEECGQMRKRIDFLRSGVCIGDEDFDAAHKNLQDAENMLNTLLPWGIYEPSTVSDLAEKGVLLSFYRCPIKRFDPAWESAYALTVVGESEGNRYFVIAYTPDTVPDIPLVALQMPASSTMEAKEAVKEAELALHVREKELEAERAGIGTLEDEYRNALADLDRYLANVSAEKASEERIDVMEGFAPSSGDENLKSELDRMGVFYVTEAAGAGDRPPIKLKNNKFVSMFEVLTDMYGRPSYTEFDPTPFISVFFLLFFAMCMGDAGYGLILIIAGALLKKVRSFSKLAPLVTALGAGTFVVGTLFHTFFSVDIAGWSWIPECVKNCMVPSKIAGYDGTMILALVIGIIHLCLAMVVRTVCALKNKGFLESLGTVGWTLFITGGVVTGALCLAGVIDSGTVKTVLCILGAVSAVGIFILNDIHRNPLKNIGSGLWETYNTVTGILGDVLSYLRLYALGLAGSMLGLAFNNLGGMALGDGGLGWIPFILIVAVGHTLNIAMAVLGAFVHPLRLNFLEFFKNSGYEGSGRNYNPLTNKQS